MSRVVKGRLIEVENKDRKFGSATSYIAIQVEDANGRNERCILFTEAEIAKAEERAKKNPEDLTKKGFFTDLLD
jgi:hypothetical protein